MCCEASLRLCVDILQQTEASKSPKSLTFQVFWHYETSKILIFRFSIFFQNFRIFLNVSKGLFLIFCNKLDFQKAETVPPFTIL